MESQEQVVEQESNQRWSLLAPTLQAFDSDFDLLEPTY